MPKKDLKFLLEKTILCDECDGLFGLDKQPQCMKKYPADKKNDVRRLKYQIAQISDHVDVLCTSNTFLKKNVSTLMQENALLWEALAQKNDTEYKAKGDQARRGSNIFASKVNGSPSKSESEKTVYESATSQDGNQTDGDSIEEVSDEEDEEAQQDTTEDTSDLSSRISELITGILTKEMEKFFSNGRKMIRVRILEV